MSAVRTPKRLVVRRSIFILTAAVLLWPLSVLSATPADTVLGLWKSIQESSVLIQASEARESFIRNALQESYDFDAFYRKILFQYWGGWSEDQKKNFSERFQSVFLKTLVKKLQKIPKSDVILDLKATSLQGAEATVFFRGKRGSRDIGFKVFLIQGSSRWKIYDVEIEGALLSRNYQGQFNRILRRESFEGLLTKLDQKLDSR